MLKLSDTRVRNEKNYVVGYSKDMQCYVMSCTITCWIIDYDRWFKITEEEYEMFNTDIKELDTLKDELINDLGNDRFLFSWKKDENTPDGAEMLHNLLKSTGGEMDEQ